MTLSAEMRTRAAAQVKSLTEQHKHAKHALGNIQAFALPVFDCQEDLDQCRPEDQGTNFLEYNEFATEILKGLRANGVPAKPVMMRYTHFVEWLGSKPITQAARADFAAYLLAGEGTGRA
jgi:hypothetical protein